MAEEDVSDQRRGPRVGQHFMARYVIPGRAPKQWLVSPLRDLSSGGARFLSEHPFASKDVLELQLVLPNAQQPVVLKARVAWIRPAPMGMHEVGVTFDPGDATIQSTIDTAVNRIWEKRSEGSDRV